VAAAAAVALAAALLVGGGGTARAATATESGAAQAVYTLINAERAANGLPALGWSVSLVNSSHAHNNAMAAANQMSHQLPGEAALGARVSAAQVNWSYAAENIGWTTDTSVAGAQSIHQQMYNETPPNDGHRRNILSPSVRYVGVDVVIDAATGKLWLTEDYADQGGVVGAAPAAAPVTHEPRGHIDSVQTRGLAATVTGWAYDPDNRAASLWIRATVDGDYVSDTRSDIVRLDVARASGTGPRPGFAVTVPLTAGTHTVCVTALSIGAGSNTLLYCAPVTASAAITQSAPPRAAIGHEPRGRVESVQTRGLATTAVGWAYDPDNRAAPLWIRLTRDGVYAGDVRSAVARPDVAKVSGTGPSQGFTFSVGMPAGKHTLCLTALNIGAGSNTTLYCTTVTAG